MAENNTQNFHYEAEINELSKNLKNINAQVESIKSVCAERYRMDFCSEIKVLQYSINILRDNYNKLETEIKNNANDIFEHENKYIELSGQLNSLKLKLDELFDNQNKQSESKIDFWKQIIIIVLGTLIVSLTVWITNNAINSFKENIYKNIKEEQMLNAKLIPSLLSESNINVNAYKNNK